MAKRKTIFIYYHLMETLINIYRNARLRSDIQNETELFMIRIQIQAFYGPETEPSLLMIWIRFRAFHDPDTDSNFL